MSATLEPTFPRFLINGKPVGNRHCSMTIKYDAFEGYSIETTGIFKGEHLTVITENAVLDSRDQPSPLPKHIRKMLP